MRLKAYLEAAGHASDPDRATIPALSHNRKRQETRRQMHPDAIDRLSWHPLSFTKFGRQARISFLAYLAEKPVLRPGGLDL
jgi:hypothetical protein